MGDRLELQTELETILGSRNVYFQPPETIKMAYPCIIYSRVTGDTQFANNKPYTFTIQYRILVVDKNPDSLIPKKVAELPTCTFDRHYVTNNLNHDVFNIYY